MWRARPRGAAHCVLLARLLRFDSTCLRSAGGDCRGRERGANAEGSPPGALKLGLLGDWMREMTRASDYGEGTAASSQVVEITEERMYSASFVTWSYEACGVIQSHGRLSNHC